MDMNKRALTALFVIVVLTFSTCGALGLTATKADAACSWTSVMTSGKVGDSLMFTIHVDPVPDAGHRLVQFAVGGPIWQDQNIAWRTGTISDAGDASFTYTFTQAGHYTVASPDCGMASVGVDISESASAKVTKSDLTGRTTGTAGASITYEVKPQMCTAPGNCQPLTSPMEVMIDVVGPGGAVYPKGMSDATGVAKIPVPFTQAGTYTLTAHQAADRRFESDPLTVTIAEKSDNNGGDSGSGGGGLTPAGGDSSQASANTSTAKTNETAPSLESASGAASSPMDLFWWVLGIGAIILVAVIAAFLFLRRREDDEEYEGDVDDEYRGYEVRRR